MIEEKKAVYGKVDIERLTDSALDVMCAHVQKSIGHKYGDCAAQFWSGTYRKVIEAYVISEIENGE